MELGEVIFLEFTRAMDNPDNMVEALATKGQQYSIPMEALRRAQTMRTLRHSSHISSVSTAPLIFGVRGTVLVTEAANSLAPLKMTSAQLRKVLAHGVRAAITAASDMCSARFAALRCLPAAPRGPNGKHIKIVIPPKPAQQRPWRSDRGWGQTAQQ